MLNAPATIHRARASRASNTCRLAGKSPLGALIVTVCAVLFSCAALAQGFVVEQVALRVVNDVYHLDADIGITLTPQIVEALENGVAITVMVETDVVRKRRWTWNETITDVEARYAIEYHALSGQYVSKNLELGLSRNYHRLKPLLDDLGKVRDFPLIAARRLSPDDSYSVRVRARLDIESLPVPMRPRAYLNSLWRLQSDWYEWPIERTSSE
ncbi:MAG: DUF4390 domain-containing protein [Gammaproteobacteria bacterium]|nr:DUF4390 domain-containing protein [Gammaproteobacteria bacterium]